MAEELETLKKEKQMTFTGEIPNERTITKNDLKLPKNLKIIFQDIRNHFAGMATGITRDEALAQEIINLLFCKIYDELNTQKSNALTFQILDNENADTVKEKIANLFKAVKSEYNEVFSENDQLNLDSNSLYYVVKQLQYYLITKAERDVITEAFEVFIGPALRGGEGQFFTPRNVIKMMVEILDPLPGENLIDPACGSGSILVTSMESVLSHLEKADSNNKCNSIEKKKATAGIVGIDKDHFLAKVTRAYLAIIGNGKHSVFCENSLAVPTAWSKNTQERVNLGTFDIVASNPPHGARIQVKGNKILEQYDLAKIWLREQKSKTWKITSTMRDVQPPQILFIERCFQLLKQGGRMGIILPESLFGSSLHGYIMEWLKKNGKFVALISMPEELFQPYTHNKTCVAIIEKTKPTCDYPIFMAIADWCGHDSRGNPVPYDDTQKIAEKFKEYMSNRHFAPSRLGFVRNLSEINGNIFIAKYYDPEIDYQLEQLKSKFEVVEIDQLIKQEIISISTGVEIGKLAYGTGIIPFVRTSDISNWELKIDPKQGVSEDIYKRYIRDGGLQKNDILMVRDGSYLIGTVCMITRFDTKILFQSHIMRIRVLKPDILSPFLLLVALSTPIAKRQIKAKQFTQNIIDSLGNRITEVVIPIPRDEELRTTLIKEAQRVIEERAELRERAREIPLRLSCGEKKIN